MENKVKIVIVEDEFIIAEELKEKLIQFGYKVFGPFDNSDEALKEIGILKPDVVLMDINIKGTMDGVELAEKVSKEGEIAIIFLSALSDSSTVERAKKIKPAAYIIKPYEDRNLAIAIDLAFSNIAENKESENSFLINDKFFIKENNRFVKIRLEDVYYLEAQGSYTELHTNHKVYTMSMNLKNLSSKIANENLQRVHRSFVINIEKIQAFDGNQVIVNNIKIPVASSYKDDLFKKFKFI